jgi:hypothetical protein
MMWLFNVTFFQIIIDIIDDRGTQAVPPIVDKLKNSDFVRDYVGRHLGN